MPSPEHPEFPRQSIPGNTHVYQDGDVRIDVYRFIDLTKDVPTQEISISQFEAALDDHCWSDENGNRISIREVLRTVQDAGGLEKAIEASPALAEHLRKIGSADTSFPIHMHNDKVVDGMHRLAKSVLAGATSLQVKRVEAIPLESILPPDFDTKA